eukprot:jgi/Botrbrau1/3194/Bobra.37_2s0024.1
MTGRLPRGTTRQGCDGSAKQFFGSHPIRSWKAFVDNSHTYLDTLAPSTFPQCFSTTALVTNTPKGNSSINYRL